MMRRSRTSHTAGWKATLGAIVASVGLLAIADTARAQVANPPTADRLWGGCQLRTNETNALASAAGFPFDFAVLHSLRPNDGQRLKVPGDPAFTGPIVCTAQGASIQSTSESVVIPNGGTGGTSIDIRAPVVGQAVRYDPGPRKQICHDFLGDKECFRVENVAGSSACTIPSGTYDAIVRAFNGVSPIVRAEAGFAFAVVYSRDGSRPPAVCAAPNHRAIRSTGDRPEAISGITIAEVEDMFILYYRINGGPRNGRIEAQFCEGVADKTDCFGVRR